MWLTVYERDNFVFGIILGVLIVMLLFVCYRVDLVIIKISTLTNAKILLITPCHAKTQANRSREKIRPIERIPQAQAQVPPQRDLFVKGASQHA